MAFPPTVPDDHSLSPLNANPEAPPDVSVPTDPVVVPHDGASLEDIVAWLIRENVSDQDVLATAGTPNIGQVVGLPDRTIRLPAEGRASDDSHQEDCMFMVRYVLTMVHYQIKENFGQRRWDS